MIIKVKDLISYTLQSRCRIRTTFTPNLVPPENFEISTPPLKAGCSASEL